MMGFTHTDGVSLHHWCYLAGVTIFFEKSSLAVVLVDQFVIL